MKKKILLICGISLMALAGCKTTNQYILPKGNIAELNYSGNESAPVARPKEENSKGTCYDEFYSKKQEPLDGVKPSRKYLQEILKQQFSNNVEIFDYLTESVESITFLGPDNGFIALSHPPNKVFSEEKQLPIDGSIGGTDIFEFQKEGAGYTIKNLGNKINTEFWDSHPCAITDSEGNLLLIWSSDRPDNFSGYSSPYSNGGNTDIYYCFRTKGKWGDVKNLASAGGDICLDKSNDGTPHIFCLCWDTKLYFSSNRQGSQQIYSAGIKIDFKNQLIVATGTASKLEGDINSDGDNYYPFIPTPYGKENYLYFASNRYKDSVAAGENRYMKNKGGFDIYRFPVKVECRAPIVTYKVELRDATNPKRKVPNPYIEICDADGKLIQKFNTDKAEVRMSITKPDINPDASAFLALQGMKKIRVRGGSMHNQIVCDGNACSIRRYKFAKEIKYNPDINRKKDTTLIVENVVGAKKVKYFDSTETVMEVLPSEMQTIRTDGQNIIKSVETADGGKKLKLTMLKITEMEKDVGGREVSERMKTVLYDTIPRWDTTFAYSYIEPSLSEKSMKSAIPEFFPESDLAITDVIYVSPEYYCFPPCEWKYVDTVINYRRNVPYFQTGYWEVNTKADLPNHLARIQHYKGANFIELSPDHSIFGEDKPKREKRIEEYRQFGAQVELNLSKMSGEIIKNILPQFNELLKIQPENKLIIQVHGFSDIRPIEKGWYIGDDVDYYAGSFDTSKSITSQPIPTLKKVEVLNKATMVGEDNDVLSKLRAYYGYMKLKERILKMNDTLFAGYMKRGEVFFPEVGELKNAKDFPKIFDKYKIIFLVEGRKVDARIVPEIEGYVGKKGDFYALDWVRRINVIVNRVEHQNGELVKTPCCTETQPTVKVINTPLIDEKSEE